MKENTLETRIRNVAAKMDGFYCEQDGVQVPHSEFAEWDRMWDITDEIDISNSSTDEEIEAVIREREGIMDEYYTDNLENYLCEHACNDEEKSDSKNNEGVTINKETQKIVRDAIEKFFSDRPNVSKLRVKKIVKAELAEPCGWLGGDNSDNSHDACVRRYYDNIRSSQNVMLNWVEHLQLRYNVYNYLR